MQQHRVEEGWEPLFTVKTNDVGVLGVIDVWTRQTTIIDDLMLDRV